MADFLGITKRKWLAFGIFSAIFATFNLIAAYFFAARLHYTVNVSAVFMAFAIPLVLLVLADILLGEFKKMFKIQIPKRYLGAFLFGLALFFPFPSDPNNIPRLISAVGLPLFLEGAVLAFISGFILSLVLYILSDFIAGLLLPVVAAKSKSSETKSR